jgi:hypothetical protein
MMLLTHTARVLAIGVALAVLAACTDKPSSEPTALATTSDPDIVFEDTFETNPFDRWEPVTKSAWKWEKGGKTEKGEQTGQSGVFDQFKNVDPKEAVRAPFNRNIAKGVVVGTFQFEAGVQSTARDYEHRDVCVIFGYQDPAHMYYVHLGKVTDKNSNGIFLVNGKDRVKISSPDVPGTPWDSNWHYVRIVRSAKTGLIEVFFDDMDTAVMSVVDKTFTSGGIGIGTFDDTARFDDVYVYKVPFRGWTTREN